MKKVIFIISLCALALASCTAPYETDFDFCLDRDEFRFAADSGQSYFRIYGNGKWTATFEQQVDWVSIDKTEGIGETQVNVAHKKNEGLSRGVNLFIDQEDGTRQTLYLSQKSGLSKEKPAYSLSIETLKMLNLSTKVSIKAVSNVSAEAVDSAAVRVHYTGTDTTWLSGIEVKPEEIMVNVAENASGAERSARIELAFNGAKWADPYTVFLNIIQGAAGPQVSLESNYALDPLGTKPLEISLSTNWDKALYDYDVSDFKISENSFVKNVEYVDSTNTVIILANMNKTKDERTVTLTWNAKDSEGNVICSASSTLTQGVSPIQLDGDPIDLTKGNKFANCYILAEHEATYYCLEPKTVSGVLPAEDIADVKLLWQTSEDVLEHVAYSGGEGLVYIYKPEGVKGNAVVALTASDGTIRWSLHFWATDEPVGECTVKGITFLDRNIGALTTLAPSNAESDATGMFYQWGRKDPFPGPEDLKADKVLDDKTMKPNGSGVMSAVYPSGTIIMNSKNDNGVTLETAIQNPSTFYWGTKNKNAQDWSATTNDNYWSTTKKTDYDPCPYGYVVPDKAHLAALIGAKYSSASYGNILKCDDGSNNYLCSAGWMRRKFHNSTTYGQSQYAHTGQHPHYWSTTTAEGTETSGDATNDAERKYQGSYATQTITSTAINARRWGATIRCVKANNQ